MAADLLMVKAVTDNLEASHKEAEAKDLNIINIQFQNYADFREVHINRTILNSGTNHKPYFQGNQTNHYRGRSHGLGPQQVRGCGHGRANYQSNNGTYQYQYYTLMINRPNSMAHPVAYAAGFNHSPKHCYKGEHDINNIMEKMSINPHQQQQGNLYQ